MEKFVWIFKDLVYYRTIGNTIKYWLSICTLHIYFIISTSLIIYGEISTNSILDNDNTTLETKRIMIWFCAIAFAQYSHWLVNSLVPIGLTQESPSSCRHGLKPRSVSGSFGEESKWIFRLFLMTAFTHGIFNIISIMYHLIYLE